MINSGPFNLYLQGLLDDVRETFHIGEDQAPGGVDGTTLEMLTLHHAGADLHDDWILADLGLAPGKKFNHLYMKLQNGTSFSIVVCKVEKASKQIAKTGVVYNFDS